MIAVPCCLHARRAPRTAARSRGVSSAAVGSSRIRSRQRRRSALAMATSWRSAKLRRSTRASGSGAKSSCARAARACSRMRVAIDDGDAQQAPHRQIAERQVLGDRQRRNQAQLLRNGDDAGRDRVMRAGEAARAAVDRDLAAIRPMHAAEDAHQRRLAGAVLADQRVDLARHRRRSRRRRARASRRNAFDIPRALAAGSAMPPIAPRQGIH